MTLPRNNYDAKSTGRMFWGKSFSALLALALLIPSPLAAEDQISDAMIGAAFASASDGYSTDELLITDALRRRFLKNLYPQQTPTAEQERSALLKLLQLRKAGKLKTSTTRRGKAIDDSVGPIAEIAARVVTDRHRVATDWMLADPKLRAELQSEASKISPSVDAYAVRKSLLQLRKKRALKPELVLRVADWKREIKTFTLAELRDELKANHLPKLPGIYLFRNEHGYLYIGEASNLANRLKQHLTASDRVSLADYLASDDSDSVTVELHQFPRDSPTAKLSVRRAYESELIRSRHPKFNSRP
ncbi:GIY-YIG nuclease family protein [Planctomycetes bacterium K23_9]|uniref:GIY-YIG domain-containing protein n=1 Tax=Stieleria marina TaxID=1930275 RepID=A0A517NXM4_9BACT|nr:hypothetical protein K239x_38510 [Planctomycetes bacterium K23_9]